MLVKRLTRMEQSFSNIYVGSVFLFEDKFYMKIAEVHDVNAVDLGTGITVYIRSDYRVCPIKGHFQEVE